MKRPTAVTCFLLGTVFICARVGAADGDAWQKIAPYFAPPKEFAGKLGNYRSPLLFEDGTLVQDAKDWVRRREEILKRWHGVMGPWPEVIERPKLQLFEQNPRADHTQYTCEVEIAPGQKLAGVLLVPQGKGPFPAVVIPFYESGTSVGQPPDPKRGKLGDYGLQLAKRGFVTLSIGSPGGDARKPDKGAAVCQPLSYLGYVAVNCGNALATRDDVDPKRIWIVGHSYGGKWAMFASCLPESCRHFIRDTNPNSVAINYDPSHLIRLGVDPIRFLHEFVRFIPHVHAKDTELFPEMAYELGLYQDSVSSDRPPHRYGAHAWRYTIPGHGQARWSETFRILRDNHYRGVVSIELEDETFNGSEDGEKEGFTHSLNFLGGA